MGRKLNSVDVVDLLSDLFILRGIPGHVRSDNGPEFIAKAVRAWIAAVGAETAYIEPARQPPPGPPTWLWFLRDRIDSAAVDGRTAIARASTASSATVGSAAANLDGEVFYSLAAAKIVIEGWRRHYNASRLHSALGYRPPAPEVVPWPAPPATQAVAPKPLMH